MDIRTLAGNKTGAPVEDDILAGLPSLYKLMAIGTAITVRDNVRPGKEYEGKELPPHAYFVLRREGRKICMIGYDIFQKQIFYGVRIDKKLVWLSPGIVKKVKVKKGVLGI